MPRHYAICLTVVDGDTALQATVRRTDLLAKVVGTDAETDAALETTFQRYILNPALLPLNEPETTVTIFVGIATEANGAGIRNVLRQDSALWREVRFAGQSYPRAAMEARLQQLAAEAGCERHWTVTMESDLTGDLLAKFVPLAHVTP